MSTSYKIGQLAKQAGVPTTTVRYYERRGLLCPAARAGSGAYRTYGDDELEQLRFIRAAQASGFALDDAGILLGLRDGQTTPCNIQCRRKNGYSLSTTVSGAGNTLYGP